MIEIYRTRFAKDIVAEVALPPRQQGKVIILASGLPSSPSKDTVLAFLAALGYVAVLPRYRGVWESQGNFLERSPAQDVEDVVKELSRNRSFRDIYSGKKIALKIKNFTLIGASFGGPAVLLNSHLPQVRKVIALSPVIDWNSDPDFTSWTTFASEAFGDAIRFKGKKKMWNKLRDPSFYSPMHRAGEIDGGKIMIFQPMDDDVIPYRPALDFAQRTHALLILKKRGGHLGSRDLLHRFYWKRVEKFLKD